MTKRISGAAAVLAFSLAVVGCGSSSDSNGGDTTGPVSGTISGAAYTTAESRSITASAADCQATIAPTVTLGLSMAVADLSDKVGVCAAAACQYVKNSRNVTVILVRAHVGSSAASNPAPGIAVGTYTFADLSNPASLITIQPDTNGNLNAFTAVVTSQDATCQATPFGVSSGTLSVTAVSATSISGRVSLTLANNAGSLSGEFTAATCGYPEQDACALLNGIVAGTAGNQCPTTPTCN